MQFVSLDELNFLGYIRCPDLCNTSVIILFTWIYLVSLHIVILNKSSTMSLFSKATKSFVQQIEGDYDGSLIHVSHLNDSQNLVPLVVVVKHKRFWPWQTPKYQPSDFTLGDLLLGEATLNPVVSEAEFLSYQGTFEDNMSGNVNAQGHGASVELERTGSSKMTLSFGKLQKQQVNVKMLDRECGARLVNMEHSLVQQLQKRKQVLAVLKERIFTTTHCAITKTHKKQESCWGALTKMEISVKDKVSVEVETDVSLGIPAQTVIAYSVMELEIEKNGNFKICFQPHTVGGFEVDSGTSSPSCDAVDNQRAVDDIDLSKFHNDNRAISASLNSELQRHEGYLFPLAELPERRELLKMLVESLQDRDTLQLQEKALQDWCGGADEVESQPLCTHGPTRALLDLLHLGPVHQLENGSPAECSPPPQLTAVHLLVSAMEALPDETRSLLTHCSPEVLQAIHELICQLRGSYDPLPDNSVPTILLEEDGKTWKLMEQLLHSSCVSLERTNDGLKGKTGSEKGDLPLVLCLTLRGLSLLCN